MYFISSYYEKQQAMSEYFIAGKYYEQGKDDLAIALLNQSISKYSENYGPYYLLGNLYIKKQNLEFALQMYKMALQTIAKKGNIKAGIDKQNIEKKIDEIEAKLR